MLISAAKKPSTGEVVVFKLVSGEEVVGKVTDITADAVTITKPILLVAQMMPNGQAALNFAPFMVGAEEAGNYRFNLDRLVCGPMTPRQDISSNYLKATTGLDIPGTQGLLKP